ncbi:ABC transporter permease [Halovenus rubra]|uniref:ABC transporter permease n=2 Tax=Halovenus rubra TaxID=869890 RepID=A0ACC7DZ44_9EURY
MRPRKLLRIARWEVTKNAGGVDRQTVVIALVALALFTLVVPFVMSGETGLDEGLYRVSVDEDSQFSAVVESESAFAVRDGDVKAVESGDVELYIEPGLITFANTTKGVAAYEQLQSSVDRYNNRELRQEVNQTAAFPVSVVLDYREQGGLGESLRIADSEDEESESSAETGDDSDGGETERSGESGATDGTDGDSSGESDGSPTLDSDGSGSNGGGIGGFGASFNEESVSGSPSDIDPPFPFQSLVLAFLVVIPLNFLIQAYGSTILSERTNRRGELLLVSPVSRFDIIGGKTLPYFLGGMVLESVIVAGLFLAIHGRPGGFISILAVTPLVLLFLSATFLGAMFARSFKELTFVTVTITVTLTSYAFVPAIFTDVGAVALISPLTLLVRELQTETIAISEFVFSTTPPLLCSGVFFGLGAGLYREEDMFDQRSLRGRVLDALVGPIPATGGTGWITGRLDSILPVNITPLRRYIAVGGLTVGLIPFVFVVQLLAIALLFALGEISIILILIVVAVVEELAKSLHIYAGYTHGLFASGRRTALFLGVASGVGFFIAEKVALLAQLVGLPELAVADAGLQGGIIPGPAGLTALLFLFAPLLLHVVTAAISAVGARRGKREYTLAVGLAMLVHLGYNLTVVSTLV